MNGAQLYGFKCTSQRAQPHADAPSLVRFGLLAVALVVGGSACQAPPEPWPQSVERAPPLPYREPIAVATRSRHRLSGLRRSSSAAPEASFSGRPAP